MKLFDLTDKVAIVTGGNGGIGLSYAKGLVKAGAKVAIWGRNAEKNESAKKERRSFIKKAGATSLALSFAPNISFSKDKDFEYSVLELMGKTDIELVGKGINLRPMAHDAFVEMKKAAYSDGIDLKVVSSYRNFSREQAIWERKYDRYTEEDGMEPLQAIDKIIEYSTVPGTSRHHWGTDLDLNNLNNSYFNNGKGEKEYNWLVTNANAFGFYQVYTTKGVNRTGYNLEKWHWSYLPLASQYLAFYNSKISTDAITDFKGSELAKELKIITNYVNGIAKNAKDFN